MSKVTNPHWKIGKPVSRDTFNKTTKISRKKGYGKFEPIFRTLDVLAKDLNGKTTETPILRIDGMTIKEANSMYKVATLRYKDLPGSVRLSRQAYTEHDGEVVAGVGLALVRTD